MALEITGRLFKIMPEVTGEGKNGTWRKQEFVIETLDDKYPKKVCFEVWGNAISQLTEKQEGETIKVSFDIESREYQSRWYTGVKAWRIERDGATTATNTGQATQTRQNAPIQQDPYPDELISNSADDLPF